MSVRDVGELLWPGAERDPEFRAEVERLSVFGLRAVAGLSVGANLLAYALLLLWLPSIPVWVKAADMLATLVFVAGVALTFVPRASPYARVLCLLMLAATSAVQVTTMVNADEVPYRSETVVPVFLAIVLLVVVAVLPVKPVQSFALGTWMIAWYFWHSFGRTRFVDLSLEDAFPVLIMLIVLVMSTVVTAVVYRQRFEAFSARRAAEESFKALEDAQGRLLVSQNARSQSRLAAALAHELNTPLGALTSAFDTLTSAHKRNPSDDERLNDVVVGAANAGKSSLKRLAETVDRMRRVTNLDRAELQRVDLNQLWSDTVNLLDDELAPRVRFEMHLESVPSISARPQQLAAVFSNLVRNAASAIEAAGSEGTIRVTTSTSDEEIVMEVTDDGPGIDAELLPSLFEPMFRAERGRVGTANWGLFTSRGIVTAHGGEIELESERGRGTTARVRLPVPSR